MAQSTAFHRDRGGAETRTTPRLAVTVARSGALQIQTAATSKPISWSLIPVGVGRVGSTATTAASPLTSQGGTVVDQNLGPLSAWYRTGTSASAGSGSVGSTADPQSAAIDQSSDVEQGFTVTQRPGGTGDLDIDLQSSGDLTPTRATATSVSLKEADGSSPRFTAA